MSALIIACIGALDLYITPEKFTKTVSVGKELSRVSHIPESQIESIWEGSVHYVVRLKSDTVLKYPVAQCGVRKDGG